MENHDSVTKWKHFPCCWPFVRGIHRWPVDSPHKGHRRVTSMLSLSCAWTNVWANNRYTGDLTRHCAHYYVTVIWWLCCLTHYIIPGYEIVGFACVWSCVHDHTCCIPWYNKIWLCLNVTIWSSQTCFSVIFFHFVMIQNIWEKKIALIHNFFNHPSLLQLIFGRP